MMQRNNSLARVLLALLLCVMLLFSAVACTHSNDVPEDSNQSSGLPDDSSTPTPDDPPEPDSIYDLTYTPTRFDKATAVYTVTDLAAGVQLIANEITLSNGNKSVVWAVEVDLSKADIRAGTKDNAAVDYTFAKATPYRQLTDWQKANPGRKVLAAVNADFFGAKTVNAFVKDGVIVKDSHNDNGNYDYLNLDSDLPASAPLLFGITQSGAKIAPMIAYTGDITQASVKQPIIKAKLSYRGVLSNSPIAHSVQENQALTTDSLALLTRGSMIVPAGGVALKLDLSGGYADMEVLEKIRPNTSTTVQAGDNVGYLIMHENYTGNGTGMKTIPTGGRVAVTVTSPDDTWSGVHTLLGCRQALVLNGEVAATVGLENSNGAQSAGIPRTAIGVKADGKVVVFAVEGLRYGRTSQSDDDPYGLNLPQLAEFIRFFGCKDAANFDGGGSTQLIVHKDGEHSVTVRSSDYGTRKLTDSRVVMNTLLVVEKED